MYYEAISQCTQMLKNIEGWLVKAETHAAAKKFDVNTLMTDRLAPDMEPLIYQIQSACDYVKAAAAWLSGQVPPKHQDNEQTIDDMRARVRKTVAFAEGVRKAQYAGASDRKVSLSWAPGKRLGGKDYLLQMTIPNTYFHVAIAYAILVIMESASARWIFLALLIGSMPDPPCCRCSRLSAFVPACERR